MNESAWEDGLAMAQACAAGDAAATRRLLKHVDDWGPPAWWLAREFVAALRASGCDPVEVLRKWAELRGVVDEQRRTEGRMMEANPPTLDELRALWPELWDDDASA
jgi:hypothetical protein